MTSYSPTNSKMIEQELKERENLFALAIKSQDTKLTDFFLADSYFLAIGVEGSPFQIISRENWQAGLKDYVTKSFSIEDLIVNVYGNTAVVLMYYTQQATVRGENRNAQFVITDVWVKSENDWKIVSRHSSRPEISNTTRPQ